MIQRVNAANDYLSLPPFYENKMESRLVDTWGTLLKLRNLTQFSLWTNFSSTFPNMTSLEIPEDLMRLKEVPMASFIDHLRGYRNINVQDQPLSLWSYVIIIFSTVIALGVIVFA